MAADRHISIKYEFPDHESLMVVAREHSYNDLASLAQTLMRGSEENTDFMSWVSGQEARTWGFHLFSRIGDLRFSFWLMEYYFQRGIPDDEWFISPGRSGSSVEYFPHFEDADYGTKQLFDYFMNGFYLHLFSAWDTIGHWLNEVFDLGMSIEEVHFRKAVKKLKRANRALYSELTPILADSAFAEASNLRTAIVHRHHPGSVGSGFTWEDEGAMTIGVGQYTPSKQVRSNAVAVMALLHKTLEAIVEHEEPSADDGED